MRTEDIYYSHSPLKFRHVFTKNYGKDVKLSRPLKKFGYDLKF
jgi:hypothetical protein